MLDTLERAQQSALETLTEPWKPGFEIIQGGMGFGVSNYEMAGEVAKKGELGVVSAVGSGMLLLRGLQDGSERATHTIESLADFPDQELVQKIIDRFYNPKGRGINSRTGTLNRYKKLEMLGYSVRNGVDREAEELNMVGAFAEVAMAKKIANGKGKVGLNLLEKIQEPTMSALYGAMLAGVDTVVMGAGIPRYIPEILDGLSRNEAVRYPLDVTGATSEEKKNGYFDMHFNPRESYPKIVEALEKHETQLKRPKFLAIVASEILAKFLHKKARPDGFVIELPVAGGHNASPRPPNKQLRNERGEPVYGDKDKPDFEAIKALGLPFWVAGGYGNSEGLQEAKEIGAEGVQVGSAFALTVESGIEYDTKREILKLIMENSGVDIRTDPLASPTGFPFKLIMLPGTLAEAKVYASRERVCDLGYLRHKVRHEAEDGFVDIVYRCPSEPVDAYVKKGGEESDTLGRMCLCNGLAATINMPQLRRGEEEPKVLTAGDSINEDIRNVNSFLGRVSTHKPFKTSDVVDYLRSGQDK